MADEEFWQFDALELRIWQQFRSTNEKGVSTVSRSCTATNEFYLVRFPAGDTSKLTPEELRFVTINRTPNEPDPICP